MTSVASAQNAMLKTSADPWIGLHGYDERHSALKKSGERTQRAVAFAKGNSPGQPSKLART